MGVQVNKREIRERLCAEDCKKDPGGTARNRNKLKKERGGTKRKGKSYCKEKRGCTKNEHIREGQHETLFLNYRETEDGRRVSLFLERSLVLQPFLDDIGE